MITAYSDWKRTLQKLFLVLILFLLILEINVVKTHTDKRKNESVGSRHSGEDLITPIKENGTIYYMSRNNGTLIEDSTLSLRRHHRQRRNSENSVAPGRIHDSQNSKKQCELCGNSTRRTLSKVFLMRPIAKSRIFNFALNRLRRPFFSKKSPSSRENSSDKYSNQKINSVELSPITSSIFPMESAQSSGYSTYGSRHLPLLFNPQTSNQIAPVHYPQQDMMRSPVSFLPSQMNEMFNLAHTEGQYPLIFHKSPSNLIFMPLEMNWNRDNLQVHPNTQSLMQSQFAVPLGTDRRLSTESGTFPLSISPYVIPQNFVSRQNLATANMLENPSADRPSVLGHSDIQSNLESVPSDESENVLETTTQSERQVGAKNISQHYFFESVSTTTYSPPTQTSSEILPEHRTLLYTDMGQLPTIGSPPNAVKDYSEKSLPASYLEEKPDVLFEANEGNQNSESDTMLPAPPPLPEI